MSNHIDFEMEELFDNIISQIQDIPEFSDYDIEIEMEIKD